MCLFGCAEMKLQKKHPEIEQLGVFLSILKPQALSQCP
jgi:hypothetical protein